MQTLIALFFLLAAQVAAAQTISGTIRDAQTREPLPGAVVLQTGSDNATISDASGSFTLTLVSVKTSEISIRFLGYREETRRISSARVELTVLMIPDTFITEEILVMGHRVDASVPVTYSNISGDEIRAVNLGKDLPVLLQSATSVVSTSDAGAGVGYTSIRIRGVDDTRINVTINGIPVNDAESHGVFWVNMPDFASSVGNIQIQRGVGTSTNGPAAFGATVNIQTSALKPDPFAEVLSGYGSFNTWRHTFQVGTGLLQNGWSLEGRLSAIQSDGFIDRAASDLNSWYVSASRYGKRDLLKANVFSGREKTYQAWNGVPESRLNGDIAGMNFYADEHWMSSDDREHLLDSGNRTFNSYTYDNQIDNYGQDHYQLHYSYRIRPDWHASSSLHYTRGRGYFEEFVPDDRLNRYNLADVEIGSETITRSDIIRRRWLDNHFYGIVASTEYQVSDTWQFSAGGGYNIYDGDHFGEVIWARIAPNADIRHRYYDNNGLKKDFNLYGRLHFSPLPDWNLFLDSQIRTIDYSFLGFDNAQNNVQQTDRTAFFNPKAGVVFRPADGHRVYLSYSVGNKEPTRREYTRSTPDSRPEHETLRDIEAGYRMDADRWTAGLNVYRMNYLNQLVLTGEVNDVGAYIRTNVEKSHRSGVEMDGTWQLDKYWQMNGNLTLSRNKIPEFIEYLDNYDDGGQAEIIYKNTDISFSPNIISAAGIRYKNRGFSGDITGKYVGRQFLDNTGTKSRSLNPYAVTDMILAYQVDGFGSVRSMQFQVQINNLLNNLYESNGYTYGWISDGAEKRFNFYYPQAGRHFMMQVRVGL